MPKIRARERHVEYTGRLVNTGKTTPSGPSFSSLYFSQNESLQNQRYASMHFYQERRGFPASLRVYTNGFCNGQLIKPLIFRSSANCGRQRKDQRLFAWFSRKNRKNETSLRVRASFILSVRRQGSDPLSGCRGESPARVEGKAPPS